MPGSSRHNGTFMWLPCYCHVCHARSFYKVAPGCRLSVEVIHRNVLLLNCLKENLVVCAIFLSVFCSFSLCFLSLLSYSCTAASPSLPLNGWSWGDATVVVWIDELCGRNFSSFHKVAGSTCTRRPLDSKRCAFEVFESSSGWQRAAIDEAGLDNAARLPYRCREESDATMEWTKRKKKQMEPLKHQPTTWMPYEWMRIGRKLNGFATLSSEMILFATCLSVGDVFYRSTHWLESTLDDLTQPQVCECYYCDCPTNIQSVLMGTTHIFVYRMCHRKKSRDSRRK